MINFISKIMKYIIDSIEELETLTKTININLIVNFKNIFE